MSRKLRTLLSLFVLAVTALVAGPSPAAAAAADEEKWITLVTGDRVLLRPDAPRGQDVVVRPARGREHVRFRSYTDRGDTYVVPSDAAGRDRELFNLTKSGGARRAAVTATAVETFDVTIRVLDHNGRRTATWSAVFNSLDTEQSFSPYDPSGTVVAKLPRGSYYLQAQVETGPLITHVVEPLFVVDGDRTLDLVATEGKPVGITLDRPEAVGGEVALIFERYTPDGRFVGQGHHAVNFDNTLVRPSTTAAPPGQFTFYVAGRFAKPDGAGGFAGSPYLYHLQWVQSDRVPEDLVRRISDDDLAIVNSTFAASARGKVGQKDYLVSARLPFSLREYYIPDTHWLSSFGQFDGAVGDSPEIITYSGPKMFTAGTVSDESWGVAAFGPSFPPSWPWSWTRAVRSGETLDFEIPLFTDQNPIREARSTVDRASTVLYRDGREVGHTALPGKGTFTVPPGEASYRLTTTARRSGVSDLSAEVRASWTFKSSTGEQRLPLAVVRFAPDLDEYNRAASGPFSFPVHVQRQDGSTPGAVRRLSVEISYDDGRLWRPVRLAGAGDQWTATVVHPRSGHASLRATLVDASGNRAELAILRAYRIR
ncbi:hypothetical protein AB0B45_24555 [Nonomuraea sp. NPDC049152]|uniref:hypothetical protein n=1 Tax=Nonomuraea sp. NPDC049152 TaxID=3154350 RepID=UPI0033EE541D